MIDFLISAQLTTNAQQDAVVRIIHKKGDTLDMNNYRGVSILPPIAKIFEKILANQIKSYFSKNKLLTTNQHGFREAHSCETAIHEITNECLKNLDNKLINALLFVDFKKAFDLVNQDILIYKLLNYGFSNSAVKLIKSYFTNRTQAVKISNNAISERTDLTLGVGQGSVLGPLLFIIFINDLPEYLSNNVVKLFADDTTIISNGPNADTIIVNLKRSILDINEWCKHNQMFINWSKTFIMFITNKHAKLPDSIQIDDQKIQRVKTFKLLGVTIDDKLTFKAFVDQQRLAINRRLYMIKRHYYLPTEVKVKFFKAFIMPCFDYCASQASTLATCY